MQVFSGIENPNTPIVMADLPQLRSMGGGKLPSRSLILVDMSVADLEITTDTIKGLIAGRSDCVVQRVAADESIKDVGYAQQLMAHIATERGMSQPQGITAIGGGTLINLTNYIVQQYDERAGVRLPYHVVPTTLLALTDVALGSKGNLNVEGVKHKVRTYRDPNSIILNGHFFDHLPKAEVQRGMVECYKHALLQDAAHPNGHERNWVSLGLARMYLRDHFMALRDLVGFNALGAVTAKADILRQDPREETWLAGLLSYGHLHAHAAEMASGFKLAHGDSVAYGILVDLKLAGTLRLYQMALNDLCKTPLMDNLHLVSASDETTLRQAYHNETKPFFRPDPAHPESDAFYVLPLKHIGQYRYAHPESPAPMEVRQLDEIISACRSVHTDLKQLKDHGLRRWVQPARAALTF